MTKINTIDMVFHIPYNHILPTNISNSSQNHPSYLIPNISSDWNSVVYTTSNKKYFDLNGISRSVRTQGVIRYTTGSDIQFECDFIPRSNKRHVLYTIAPALANSNDTTAIFQVYVNVSTRIISVKIGTKIFNCNYIFERNLEYNILVTMTKENGLSVNINGESVSSFDYESTLAVFNNISTGNYYHFFGHYNATGTMSNDGLDGYITNIYSSMGMINRSHEDYTTNNYNKLLHFRLSNNGIADSNFSNSNVDIVNTLDVNFIRTIVGNSYKVDSNFNFSTNQSYYIIFGMDVKKSLDGITLFDNDQYKVLLRADIIIGVIPEPDVIVDEYTTSALNFENGIIDQVTTTVWNKSGGGDITTVNHIFGGASFETKALGDNLYTNSNIISGGATPFTIEFYALVKDTQPTTDSNYKPLFVNIDPSTNANNGLYINHPNNNLVYIYADEEDSWNFQSKNKILYNEINKITVTYDGAALRIFINDMMVNVIGTYYISHSKLTMLSMGSEYNNSMIKGIIDNINIFDGVATKVRDPDPYEEYLVVDLAFDGENNSTKIVDNAKASHIWNVVGNAKLSTTQKFDGFSSLEIPDMTSYIRSDNNLLDFNFTNSYTIQFDFMIRNETNYHIFFANYTSSGFDQCLIFYNHVTKNIHARPIGGVNSDNQFVLPYTVLMNVKYNFVMLFENGVYNFYINGVLVLSNESTKKFNFSSNGTTIGQYYQTGSNFYLDGFIKNFKIYKGVAVIPENPTGKIQLDFDNNVTDKYNNSTWTNNGVTFDQVNSVKGYAMKCSGGATVSVASNPNFNYNTSNYYFSMDYKRIAQTSPYGHGFFSNGYGANQSSVDRCAVVCSNETTNPIYSVNGTSTLTILNLSVDQAYYEIVQQRKNGVLIGRGNGVINGMTNVENTAYNWNFNNSTFLGKANYYSTLNFNGYLDNFKSEKDYQEPVIIDKPAVHLPLETNATNLGFTDLVINSVGSPTYTTVDGRKCIKFESGKYLTINSNNIFNLGTSSDFYIEMDIYVPSLHTTGYGHSILNNGLPNGTDGMWLQYLPTTLGNDVGKVEIVRFTVGQTTISHRSSNAVNVGAWNSLKFYRSNDKVHIELNDVVSEFLNDINLNFSNGNTHIGMIYNVSTEATMDGYISNFKMFVGTSVIPETYNDKKVLDLDFKPTGKSYLFKDNNNKCVIHPVNITQRDYQDSQYCCTFNGTNQYLQLGKNDLLNFGNDDFVIHIKFKGENGYLLKDNGSNITGISISNKLLSFANNGSYPFYDQTINYIDGNIQNITIVRKGSVLTLYSNEMEIKTSSIGTAINFNFSDNTFIGSSFNGTIYSIKVLRNTTDITLLEDEVNTTVNLEYELFNPLTEESETISSIKLNDIIQIERTSDSISLHVGEEMISLNAPSVDETNVDLFTDYRDHIQSEIMVFDKKPDAPSTYIIPPLDYSSIEAENVDGMDTITEIQYVDAGDYTIDGFTEGYPDAKFKIINRTTNEILTYGVDSYYHGGINPVYIKNYYVYLYELGIEYPLEDHKMEKGSITYYLNTTLNACVGADYRVRLLRRMDGRIIGEYQFTDGFCSISNLDKSVAYDAILFDKTNQYESVVMSNRYPLSVE